MSGIHQILSFLFLVGTGNAAIHGPIVQWSGDPSSTASIRWIEREATEGKGWKEGPAGFGYGDDDDATVLRGMEDNYASLAIRRGMVLPADLPKEAKLYLLARYDDAFVAWVDGREVARANVRIVDGKEQVINKHEAKQFEEFLLGDVREVLTTKSGVLAIEGYNDGRGSSDFTLDISVIAKLGEKRIEFVRQGAKWDYLAGRSPEGAWKTTVRNEQEVQATEVLMESIHYRAGSQWTELKVGRNAFSNTPHQVAFADLEDLPANSVVEFELNGQVYSFRTAPQDGKGIRFVAGGDMYHQRPALDAMNARAGKEDPLFALLGGDLAYTNDVKPARWFDWFDSWAEEARTPDGRLVPMVVAIGNHEVKGAGYRPMNAKGPKDAREFFSLFKMQESGLARQVIDFGKGLSLVLLDSGHAATLASQNEWLGETLIERKDVKSVFVCYHRPAWGSGTKGDAVEIQETWCPIFEEHLVDGVFENDHHVFARSEPIRNKKVDRVRGIPYLGSGAWGVKVREVPKDALSARPWLAAAEPFNHLFVIDCGEDGWTAVAKKADGTAFDRSERKWRR